MESPPLTVEWASAQRALPGQRVSGDCTEIVPFPGGVLVAVVDGVGHGDDAAAAARTAAATLRAHAGRSSITLIRHCHDALRQTRGAVITVAIVRPAEGVIEWLGIGNVEGLLVRAEPGANPAAEPVLLRNGVVGYQLPALISTVLPVARGDVLVLTTDGITSDFSGSINMRHSPQQIADRILGQFFKGTDDATVVVARYLGNAR